MLTNLRVAKQQARSELSQQIEQGQRLVDRVQAPGDLGQGEKDKTRWVKLTAEILVRVFDTTGPFEEFLTETGVGMVAVVPLVTSSRGIPNATRDPLIEVRDFHEEMEIYLERLRSLQERAEVMTEPASSTDTAVAARAMGQGVFIVHGHDEGAKQATARFIEHLGLRAIVLDEQPSAGRTIVEKFEDYAATVGYALVLLTPDDVGALGATPNDFKQRARQNVIFELGYFAGKLGRGRVCLLHKGEVDIPADLHGVVYIVMDDYKGWQPKVVNELRAAGINIDAHAR